MQVCFTMISLRNIRISGATSHTPQHLNLWIQILFVSFYGDFFDNPRKLTADGDSKKSLLLQTTCAASPYLVCYGVKRRDWVLCRQLAWRQQHLFEQQQLLDPELSYRPPQQPWRYQVCRHCHQLASILKPTKTKLIAMDKTLTLGTACCLKRLC